MWINKLNGPLTKKQRIATYCITIAAGLVVGGGIGVLAGYLLKPATVDYSNFDASAYENNDTETLLDKFETIKKNGDDPMKKLTVNEFANIANMKFAALENSTSYGFGHCNTAVNLDIRACSMRKGDVYMEESLSKSIPGAILNVVVAQRDYQQNDAVTSYLGTISSNVNEPSFDNPQQNEYTIDDYKTKFGKTVNTNCVYIISDKTILTETSYVERTADGFKVYMDLNPTYSVARYVKKMKNVSNSEISLFEYVHLTYYVNEDLELISSYVDECYYAGMGTLKAKVQGDLTSYYYKTCDQMLDYKDIVPYKAEETKHE